MRPTRLALAILPLVLALGACSRGQEDPPAVDVVGVVDEGVAIEAPEGHHGVVDWTPEYETPEDILAAMRDGGVVCEPDPGGSMSTVVSLRSTSCFTTADEMERYTISVYGSPAQQGEAHAHYQRDTSWAGKSFVWGTGWSVSVPYGSDGSEVVEILGGEVEVAGR